MTMNCLLFLHFKAAFYGFVVGAAKPMKILVFFSKFRPCFINSFSVLSADDKVIKAKSLWEANGAVIMAVRRPG